MAGQGSTSRLIPSQGVVPVRNSTLVTLRISSDPFQSMGKSVRFTIPGRRYVRRVAVCPVVDPAAKDAWPRESRCDDKRSYAIVAAKKANAP